MTAPGLIIAAPRSGAGKTTVTLALLAALRRRGLARAGGQGRSRLYRPRASTKRRPAGQASISTVGRCRPLCSTRWSREAAARADLLRDRRRHGPVRRHSRRPRRTGASADLAARFRSAGAAGDRCRRSIAIGGGCAARLRGARSGGPDRRRGAEPGRQRAARQAGGRGDRGARYPDPRRDPARCRRSLCPSGISAWCRPASMAISPRGSSSLPIWPSVISISTAFCAWPRRLTCRQADVCGAAAAGTAHRAGAGRSVQLRLPACARPAGGRRGRDRAVLAARRRGAA